MATNPYRGQEGHEAYEQAWDWGYRYGYDHPHETDYPSHAPDYWGAYPVETQGWMKQVWAEGAVEGQREGLQFGHPVTVNPAHTGGGEGPSATDAAVHIGGHGVVEAGVHTAETVEEIGLISVNTGKQLLVSAATGLATGLFIGALIFILTEIEEPDVAHTEPHELGALLARKCTEKGCSEFYLPYCEAGGHAGGGSDGVSQAGMWHGQLYFNWEAAESEAYQHLVNERHWNQTGVWHYLPSAPDEIDWMVLVAQHHV